MFIFDKLYNENDEGFYKWIDIPGGKIKFGEDSISSLMCEIKEETNLEINVVRPSRVWNLIKDDLHLVGITFIANLTGGVII